MEETIGQRLKRLRCMKQWTGAVVARKIAASRSAYCEYEHDRKVQGAKALGRLAEALETDAGYLLTGREAWMKPGKVAPLGVSLEVIPVQIATSSDVTLVLLSNGKIYSSGNHTTWIEVQGPWSQ